MNFDEKKRFTVISNPDLEKNKIQTQEVTHDKYKSYQTNPLKEQLMKFTNDEAGRRFSVRDLLLE